MVGTKFSVPEALLEHQEAGEQELTEQRGSHLAVSPTISAAPLLVPYSTQHLGHKGYVQSLGVWHLLLFKGEKMKNWASWRFSMFAA